MIAGVVLVVVVVGVCLAVLRRRSKRSAATHALAGLIDGVSSLSEPWKIAKPYRGRWWL